MPGRRQMLTARPAALRAASWAISMAPAGSGQGRLGRVTYERFLARHPSELVAARLKGGARVRLDLSDPIQAEVFLTRVYEPPLQRFIVARLAAGGTFFDIGAHVGLISLPIAARGRRSGVRVHAFEPDPANAAALGRNVELNPGIAVRVNPVAVGERTGTVQFARSTSNRALGRMSGETTDIPSAVDVPVIALDDYLERNDIATVDVAKIDVEGFEPLVLAGARAALEAGRIRCLVCEVNEPLLADNGWSEQTIRDLLAEHGYRPAPVPAVGLRRFFPRHTELEDVAFLAPGQTMA